jgi:putative membrane protein
MKPEISPSRAARAFLFMSISFFFVWLINTGKLDRIVNPRMRLWIIAAGLLFLALSFYETLRLSSPPRRADPWSHFYPLVLVFAVAYLFVQSESFQPGTFQAGPSSLAVQSALIAQRDVKMDKAAAGPLPSTIVFDDNTYWPLYNRLYDDPSAALGKRITIEGFIYRKSDFPPNSVLIARNLMWCCSADMSMIGFLAQGHMAAMPDGAWVKVSGRLDSIDFDVSGAGKEKKVPLIRIDSIEPAPRTASTTIFPY